MPFTGSSDRMNSIALVLASAMIILIPAILNGRPFLFLDSEHYFYFGKAALSPFLGSAETATAISLAQSVPETASITAAAEPQEDGLSAIAASRAITYSLPVFVLSSTVGLWFVSILQAILVSWCLFSLKKWLAPSLNVYIYLASIAVLTFLSPLGFHATSVMPDILAAVFVVCFLRLLLDPSVAQFERWVLFLVIAFAVSTHSTILLIGIVVLIGALGLSLLPTTNIQVTRSNSIIALAALIAAASVGPTYVSVAKYMSGDEIGRPPFLTARVIMDGPGEAFLRKACAEDPDAFASCIFDGHDYIDHNDILWQGQEGRPHFLRLEPETQQAIQAEEMSFVLASTANAPVSQIGASLQNGFLQMVRTSIPEIRDGTPLLVKNLGKTPGTILEYTPGADVCVQDLADCFRRSGRLKLWEGTVFWTTILLQLASLGIILAWNYRRFVQSDQALAKFDDKLHLLNLLVLTLIANAFICGALSGPHDRYQARLIWLLPVMTFFAAYFVRYQRSDQSSP